MPWHCENRAMIRSGPGAVAARVALLLIGLCSVAGCGAAAPARPVVRDGDGAALSVLRFPRGREVVVLTLVRHNGILLTDAVTVNGRSAGWFAVDTGAGVSLIDSEVAKAFGLSAERAWAAAGKKPGGITLHPVGSLAVGDVTLSNHFVAVGDLGSVSQGASRKIAGVVGGDVWGAVPFTVDYWNNQLILYRPQAFRPPQGVAARRLTIQRPRTQGPYLTANPALGQPLVGGSIDGSDASLLVDTGFGGALLVMPEFAKANGGGNERGEIVARATGLAGGMAGRLLTRADVKRVTALGATFQLQGTALALTGRDDEERSYAALLGGQSLRHGRLTFDYARRRVWAEWRPLSDGDAGALSGRDPP